MYSGATQLKAIGSAISALALLAASGMAEANPIAIFNTGVDNAGIVLAAGISVTDPHYALVGALPVGTTGVQVADYASAAGWPISPGGPWIGDSSSSRWIGPNTDDNLSGPWGFQYDYRITFDLTGLDPTTAILTGQFASDDSAYIELNHAATGITSINYFYSFTPFSISSGFVAGINTLDFFVTNAGGGPTGLRVEIAGTADTANAVPEPASLALLGLGLAAFGFGRRKKA